MSRYERLHAWRECHELALAVYEVSKKFPSDERYGLTVGSLVSLSLQPPLVGISIGRESSSHEPIRRAGQFAVSLLSGEQDSVAQHFARSGIPPVALWVGVDVRDGARGEEQVRQRRRGAGENGNGGGKILFHPSDCHPD